MKNLGFVKDIVGTKDDINKHIYEAENGVYVRDIEIEADGGEEVSIGVVGDLHFNYCNEKDLEEKLPAVMSSREYRLWMAGGESVPKAQNALSSIDDCDQMIVVGDTIDYLTHGAMELTKREIWDKYPEALIALGGHDTTRRMQGKVEDDTTLESRFEILQNFWKHDIFYTSKLVKNKVLCVVLNNCHGSFFESQIEPLKKDIELARKNGYIILCFAHEPICTYNPNDLEITLEMALLVGDSSSYPKNLHSGQGCGDKGSDANKTVYNLITKNADVVKGFFCGHKHSDFALDIIAENSDGTPALIPQHIGTASIYGNGHIIRIRVK